MKALFWILFGMFISWLFLELVSYIRDRPRKIVCPQCIGVGGIDEFHNGDWQDCDNCQAKGFVYD